MSTHPISTGHPRSLAVRIFGGTCAALLAVHSAHAAEKADKEIQATSAETVAESRPVQTTAGKTIIPAEAAKPAPENEPAIKEGAEVSLQGKLQGGMVGIGGESTGWRLTYQTKPGPRAIEVDCSALDAGKIPEGAVRVTGKVIKKNYVERGPTLILKATKVEKQP